MRQSTSHLRISVVIPALHEAERIQACIDSAWHAGACEVIVVDGGSRDATTSIARAAGAHVINGRRGRARQQNDGVAASTGDVSLFLHADCRLAPTCLTQIAAALARHPRHVIGAFRQHIEHPTGSFRLIERGNTARGEWCGLIYGDQAIFVRTAAFRAVGGFPEVPLMEEFGLLQRLRHHPPPLVLLGPVTVDPRRWLQYGLWRQTLRNWLLTAAYYMGVSPETLAKYYETFNTNRRVNDA